MKDKIYIELNIINTEGYFCYIVRQFALFFFNFYFRPRTFSCVLNQSRAPKSRNLVARSQVVSTSTLVGAETGMSRKPRVCEEGQPIVTGQIFVEYSNKGTCGLEVTEDQT